MLILDSGKTGYSKDMPSLFGQFVADQLEALGLSQNRFAQLLGTGSSTVNQVIHGKATPPLDRLAAWAEKLQIPEEKREYFDDLAALAHLPAACRQRMERIYIEHRQQGEMLNRLSRRVAEAEQVYQSGPRPGPSDPAGPHDETAALHPSDR